MRGRREIVSEGSARVFEPARVDALLFCLWRVAGYGIGERRVVSRPRIYCTVFWKRIESVSMYSTLFLLFFFRSFVLYLTNHSQRKCFETRKRFKTTKHSPVQPVSYWSVYILFIIIGSYGKLFTVIRSILV